MRALIILGMHRSYTSLTTQWLMRAGLHVGTELLGPSEGNLDGHFEDVDFLRFHEDILAANDLPRDGIRFENDIGFDFARFENVSVSDTHRKRASALIAARPLQFGWKDPRTCLFLPTWRALLPAATSLVLVRHFDDVVCSLDKRDRLLVAKADVRHRVLSRLRGRFRSHNAYLGAWIYYNRCLLDHINKSDSLVVTDLEKTARNVVYSLAARGFKLHPMPISDLVRPLPEPTMSKQSYPYDPRLLAEAKDLFAELAGRALQHSGNEGAIRASSLSAA
jgi:hypothetical protein